MKDPSQTTQESKDNQTSLPFLASDQKEDVQEDHTWLFGKFNRLPFMIYKFWLVLSFIFALGFTPKLIWLQFRDYEGPPRISFGIFGISSILLFLGSGMMLFAIVQMRSGFAQKSLITFQFSLIGTVLGLVYMRNFGSDLSHSLLMLSCVIALPVIIIVNLFGGFAVLRAFKKNHPLVRSQGNNQPLSDFLEQNGAIAAELLKYDEQLEKWPYLIYRFWLKFVILVEILFIASMIFISIPDGWESKNISELEQNAFMLILCPLTVFCCYEMEVVLRTKALAKSKSAIFWNKVCLFLSIIPPVYNIIFYEEDTSLFVNLIVEGFIPLTPLIALIGAYKINQVVEKREIFAKVSSYSGDHYL